GIILGCRRARVRHAPDTRSPWRTIATRGRSAMPKPEHEFLRHDHLPLEPVPASATGGAGGAGVHQKILSHDPQTGDVTRLLRFDAGVETKDTITHDFWEDVWILQGAVTD